MTKMHKTGRVPARGMLVAVVAASLLLGGCSTVRNVFDGRGKDRGDEPAQLAAITPSATAARMWSCLLYTSPSPRD